MASTQVPIQAPIQPTIQAPIQPIVTPAPAPATAVDLLKENQTLKEENNKLKRKIAELGGDKQPEAPANESSSSSEPPKKKRKTTKAAAPAEEGKLNEKELIRQVNFVKKAISTSFRDKMKNFKPVGSHFFIFDLCLTSSNFVISNIKNTGKPYPATAKAQISRQALDKLVADAGFVEGEKKKTSKVRNFTIDHEHFTDYFGSSAAGKSYRYNASAAVSFPVDATWSEVFKKFCFVCHKNFILTCFQNLFTTTFHNDMFPHFPFPQNTEVLNVKSQFTVTK